MLKVSRTWDQKHLYLETHTHTHLSRCKQLHGHLSAFSSVFNYLFWSSNSLFGCGSLGQGPGLFRLLFLTQTLHQPPATSLACQVGLFTTAARVIPPKQTSESFPLLLGLLHWFANFTSLISWRTEFLCPVPASFLGFSSHDPDSRQVQMT